MGDELYKAHRPKTFKAVKGQGEAVRVLQKFLAEESVPHAILFTGASGCGKTTLARILASKLMCSRTDLKEINCADFRGIDTVRDIRQQMSLAPLNGGARVWIIDEAQKLSNDAQNALLKILEDPPRHAYFVLCTTDPQKLLTTVRTRCTQVQVKPLPSKEMVDLVFQVAEKEGHELPGEVGDEIVKLAEGSARKALVLLHKVLGMEEVEAMEQLTASDEKAQAIMIARALFNFKTSWVEMAKILKGVDEDPESLRWMILSYASSILLNGGKLSSRAALVIDTFRDNFFDSKKAGLIVSCYQVLTGK